MVLDSIYNYSSLDLERIFPEQFFSSQRIDTGARRLMVAVLGDAVNMYQKYKRKNSRRARRLFKETEEWFVSTDNTWLYSFENICDVLGWNAQAVREALLRVNSRATRPKVNAVCSPKRIKFS